MPGQEPLPAMLAVVLMDQRLVVEIAPVLGTLVEVVDGAERLAQPLQLGLAEAVEVLALAQLTFAIRVAFRTGLDAELRDVGELQVRDLAALGLERAEIDGLPRVLGQAIVDPVGDEGDVGVGEARAAPWQRRKAPILR